MAIVNFNTLLTLLTRMADKKPTPEEIMGYVFLYFDDLDFIEKLNDLTYSRKVQLKSRAKE